MTVSPPAGTVPASATSLQVWSGCQTLPMTVGTALQITVYAPCRDAQNNQLAPIVVTAHDAAGVLVGYSVLQDFPFVEGAATVTMPGWQTVPEVTALRVPPARGHGQPVRERPAARRGCGLYNVDYSLPLAETTEATFAHAPGYADGYALYASGRLTPDAENGAGEWYLLVAAGYAGLGEIDFAEALPRVAEASYEGGAFRWRLTGNATQMAALPGAECVCFAASWQHAAGSGSWQVVAPPDVRSPLTFTLYNLVAYQPGEVVPTGYLDIYEVTGFDDGYRSFKHGIGTNPFSYSLYDIARFAQLRFQRSTAVLPVGRSDSQPLQLPVAGEALEVRYRPHLGRSPCAWIQGPRPSTHPHRDAAARGRGRPRGLGSLPRSSSSTCSRRCSSPTRRRRAHPGALPARPAAAGPVERVLRRCDRQRRRPVFSETLFQWFEDAWLVASVEPARPAAHRRPAPRARRAQRPLHRGDVRRAGALSAEQLRKDMADLGRRRPSRSRPRSKGRMDTRHDSLRAGRGRGTRRRRRGARALHHVFTEKARKGEIDPVFGRDRENPADDRHPRPPPQEQPDHRGRAGRRQDRARRGPGAAHRRRATCPTSLQERRAARRSTWGCCRRAPACKGEFENRLKGVIAEVKASPKPIILFIDEAHTLIGAGGTRRRRRRGQPAQAGARARRAAHHRRDHLGRVQEVLREGRRARAALPAGEGGRAVRGGRRR